MSKIHKIPLSKEINQNETRLQYFLPIDNTKKSIDYSNTLKQINNAKNKILIASTRGISNEIVEQTYHALSAGTAIYIILKSFKGNEKLLSQYDKNKPAVIRETPELENNFVYIDNEATLFLKELNNKTNISILLSPNESNDLFYWFNYYFWNKAEKEKILEKIDTPKESPYPPFESKRKHINLINDKTKNTIAVFPCNSNYKENISKYQEVFLSRELNTPMYLSNNQTQIGNLVFNKNFFQEIGLKYKLQESSLQEITQSIIPFNEDDWSKEVQVLPQKDIPLRDIRANSIETIKETSPDLTPEHYAKKLVYHWSVLPPIKPNNAQKAKLYTEYQTLKNKLNKDLEDVKRAEETIINSKSKFLSLFFGGAKKSANEKLQKINEWQDLDLTELDYNKLKDRFKNDGEFAKFYTDCFQDAKKFKANIAEKEQEEKWEESKKQKEEELQKIENDLQNTKNKKNNKEKELNKSKNNDSNIQTLKRELSDINKRINQLEANKRSKEADINKNYTNFKYRPKNNELEELKKSGQKEQKFKPFNIPQYALPEVGILFEDNNNYYLEIENYEDLEIANRIANNRYTDKVCKVVAKGE